MRPVQRHADTCPLVLGMDAVVEGDARWFKEHPGRNEYLRPASPAERAEGSALGCRLPTAWVVVEQLAPGVRRRRHYGAP